MLDMLERKYEIAGEQFVEDLMYGLDLTVLELGGFGEEMGELGRATLCLHSQEPRFLVLTRQLARKYHIIDPKVMRLREIDQELESLHHLERGKCKLWLLSQDLILEDEGRWILTFRS